MLSPNRSLKNWVPGNSRERSARFIKIENDRSPTETVTAELEKQIALTRLGSPEDVAKTVVFLASFRCGLYYRPGFKCGRWNGNVKLS